MTNEPRLSARTAHCSLGPDGPQNKSAQAETGFQYKEAQAATCLPFHNDRAQAPGPE